MTKEQEIARRRTFAIISHPDAGKTTLTEKFLLYGGAVQLAGSVTARKNQRASTSDWMELERKRGISISSTVLQFDYNGYRINLLDTPGHQDFSEDTYRVLTAVDAAVMVIDAGKGIETQTKKLFEVCRRRGVPIFTFMNKLDRPTLDPLALIDELESVLGIHAYPMVWPLGTGFDFKGVFDRRTKDVHLFERTIGGKYRAPVSIHGIDDGFVKSQLSESAYSQVIEELAMLDGAGAAFDSEAVLSGKLTPVYFGSASNNFGVQLLLDGFLEFAQEPAAHESAVGEVKPEDDSFSGFIFKIQANMDPRHRDRIAFLRVCSGVFERDMMVHHSRTGKKVRLSNSAKLFGQQRETVDEGYPGDIIGLVGNGAFGIGDTLTEDAAIVYSEIPRFAPEHFVFIHNPDTSKYKQFRDGLDQLLQEGVVQSFRPKNSASAIVLGAVGPLQFEVVQARLESEYGAPSRLEDATWKLMRWVSPEISYEELTRKTLPLGAVIAEDRMGELAILFNSEWGLQGFIEKNKDIALSDIPFRDAAVVAD
ncbi:MAG TPA: peptide chain release factor 3 [Candidatus Kapabacteria bacterium]|jgi:peptide chain release factor 3|nr:peptide chain release factor 3 [Candidatus Kapabacteria bacterium]